MAGSPASRFTIVGAAKNDIPGHRREQRRDLVAVDTARRAGPR